MREIFNTNKEFYGIGLITADGCLSKDHRHIDFTSKDFQLVKLFKNCFSLNNRITRKSRDKIKIKKYYRVQYSNVKMYKKLLQIGLTPHKSLTLTRLKIPTPYFFHFLRGYLDGDGCFYLYRDIRWKNSTLFYTIFYSGTKKFLLWIQKRVKQLLGIKGMVRRKSSSYRLIYGKRESKILVKELYTDSQNLRLDRKFNKIKVLNIINKHG